MRASKIFGSVLAVIALIGCGGGQPRVYRVVVNRSGLQSLPASCYTAGGAPSASSGSNTTTNQDEVDLWEVWDGPDKTYLTLDPRNLVGQLGNSPPYDFTSPTGPGGGGGGGGGFRSGIPAIEGTGHDFTEEHKAVSPGTTTTQDLTVHFDDLSGTARGNLTIASSCTNCNGTPACQVVLPFVGLQVSTQEPARPLVYGGP